ncbi:hypothetical protein D3C76_1425670 [compost metagenome]
MGPPLSGGLLNRFAVFKGGVPKHLDALLKSKPEISLLIVPVEEFKKARVESDTPGTPLYEAYQFIQKGDALNV